jgi:hypothetical protein
MPTRSELARASCSDARVLVNVSAAGMRCRIRSRIDAEEGEDELLGRKGELGHTRQEPV